MCLIVFARQCHPRYPLVVVANRDEHHQRPSQPVHWWSEPPGLLAGRDLEAGGLWLGVTQNGRWAAVTNYREGAANPKAAGKVLKSRGELGLNFLAGRDSAENFLANLKAQAYGGFNLLLGEGDTLHYFSNRGGEAQVVPVGIHSLSNHLLDTPWPKAELAKLKLAHALHAPQLEVEALLHVLAESHPFEDHELPVTGVGIELERVLSPPFIVGDSYGTRCTTVLLVDNDGRVVFAEQSFLPGGIKSGFVMFDFPRDTK